MRTFSYHSASFPLLGFAPWRKPLGAAAIVLLLTVLFAGTILAALQPHPLVDALQASVQGGL